MIFLIIAFILLYLYFWFIKKEDSKVNDIKEKNILKNDNEIISNLKKKYEEIVKIADEFNSINFYIDSNKFKKYLEKVNEFLNLLKENKIDVKKFDNYSFYLNLNKDEVNNDFVVSEIEKYDEFFSDIDGKSLDYQQREAVVKDEMRNLVIAGAGSGKTLTITAKVKYLVEIKNILPQEILLISFTKASAEEMKERITKKLGINIESNTFHSLGFKILKKFTNQDYRVIESPQTIINQNTLKQKILTDTDFALNLFEYLSYYPFDNNTELDSKIEDKSTFYYTQADLEPFSEKIKKSSYKFLLNLKILYYKENKTNNGFNKDNVLKLFGNSKTSNKLRIFTSKIPDDNFIFFDEEIKTIKQHIDDDDFDLSNKKPNDLLKKYCSNDRGILLPAYKKINLKSEEERIIANFLFLNGIDFEYEKVYLNGKFADPNLGNQKVYEQGAYKVYQPDFYLPEYDVYLEHFGVDKDEKPRQYTEEENQKYILSMDWKRRVHKLNSTKMIETYSWYHQEGILLEKLEELLKMEGIKLKPLSKEELEMFFIVTQSDPEINSFIKLISTFLNLFKSMCFEKADIERFKKSSLNLDPYTSRKHQLFLNLFETLYEHYINTLGKNDIDFNDMINNSNKFLKKSDLTAEQLGIGYKYIIIDEFQDTSVSKFELIETILEKTKAKLMVVGDDWQSIYRFAGADLNVFTDFEKHFGKENTTINFIEKTYRNSQQLINIAQNFVLQNPKQYVKNLRSDKSLDKPISIYYAEKVEEINKIIEILQRIDKKYKNTNKEIVSVAILGRNNFDFDIFKESDKVKIIDDVSDSKLISKLSKEIGLSKNEIKEFTKEELIKKIKEKKPTLTEEEKKELDETKKRDSKKLLVTSLISKKIKVSLYTAHKSKGLEADEVIMINVKDGLLGFPNKIVDDSVLSYVLKEPDEFLFGEERRLFYVAITRTRNELHIICPKNNKSMFLEEITKNEKILQYINNNNKEEIKPIICPTCGGKLIERENKIKGNLFYGCCHYPKCLFTMNKVEDDNVKNNNGEHNPEYCPICNRKLKKSIYYDDQYYCKPPGEKTHYTISGKDYRKELDKYKRNFKMSSKRDNYNNTTCESDDLIDFNSDKDYYDRVKRYGEWSVLGFSDEEEYENWLESGLND